MTAMGGDGAGKRSRRADTGVVATVVLLVVGCYAALSVDVVRTGYGLKGDEATYVAMAFSMAHDGDLVYEARDIEREIGNREGEATSPLNGGREKVVRMEDCSASARRLLIGRIVASVFLPVHPPSVRLKI